MPLPSLSVPKHHVTIPSSGKKTTFRPFLMKEQKILLVALESKDEKQIIRAMCDITENCVDGVEDASLLPLFDIEYLFMTIRSKSAGETIEAKARCSQCKETNSITVNLEQLEVVFPKDHSRKIMLSDKLGIVMKYPCLSDTGKKLDTSDPKTMVKYISESIEAVFDDEQTYSRKDFSESDADKFVDSLTTDQFEKVANFYATMPYLHKEVHHKCERCGNEYDVSFKGIQDFFT